MDDIHFFFLLACKNTTLQDEINVALCCPCCSHLDNHATNAVLLTLQLILVAVLLAFLQQTELFISSRSAPVNMYPNVSVTAQKKNHRADSELASASCFQQCFAPGQDSEKNLSVFTLSECPFFMHFSMKEVFDSVQACVHLCLC